MAEIADLQKRMEGLEARLDKSSADAQTAQDSINARIDDNSKKLDDTNKKQDDTNKKLDENTKRLDQLVLSMNNISGSLAKLTQVPGEPVTLPVSTIPGGAVLGPQSGKEKQTSGGAKTNDDEEDGYDTASSGTSKAARRKKSLLKKPKKKDSSDSEEEEDDQDLNDTGFVYDTTIVEDDGGAPQRGNSRRQPSSLNIKDFNFGEESADWTSWVKKFQGTVKGACNPRNEAEHHKLNLGWLPSYLNTAAHDVFLHCRHRNNWRKVVQELEEAFDDPGIRQRWATDLKAYTWDQKTPLHVYKSNVLRFVNKFESGLRHAPEARKKAYFTRFVGGLPDDYINFIEQQLYGSKQTVEHALKVSQQFKIIKDRTTGKKKEVAGAMNFQGNYTNERVQTLEQEVAKINTKLNAGYSSGSDRNRTKDAGHTPGTSLSFRSPGRSQSRHRSQERGSQGNSGYHGDRSQQEGRSRDGQAPTTSERFGRWRDKKYGNRQDNRQDNRHSRQSSDFKQQATDFFKKRPTPAQHSEPRSNTAEHALAMESDVPSDSEADVTMAQFMACREENEEKDFECFKAVKDAFEKGSENC